MFCSKMNKKNYLLYLRYLVSKERNNIRVYPKPKQCDYILGNDGEVFYENILVLLLLFFTLKYLS